MPVGERFEVGAGERFDAVWGWPVRPRTAKIGGMDERVFDWSRGRRVRIVVMDVPGDYESLLERVADDAQRIDDRDLLADDVSAIFGTHVRLGREETDGIEEIVLKVG